MLGLFRPDNNGLLNHETIWPRRSAWPDPIKVSWHSGGTLPPGRLTALASCYSSLGMVHTSWIAPCKYGVYRSGPENSAAHSQMIVLGQSMVVIRAFHIWLNKPIGTFGTMSNLFAAEFRPTGLFCFQKIETSSCMTESRRCPSTMVHAL